MSRILQAAVLALTASGAVTLATPAGAQDVPVRKMSLAECVAAALRDNPDIKTSTDQVAVARGGRLEAGGRLGPLLRVDGSLQEWNSDYSIPFQLDPSQPPVNFPVRDQLTWNFSASAIQPITGLWSLYETYRVRDLGVDVAAIQREATLRDVGYFRTVEAYYRLLQAERLEEVASASVEQLDGQRKRANSFHDNGVVSKDDVLRAELAVANAKQRQILARAHVSLTRSRLAVQMGLSPNAAIDAVPLAGEPSVGNDVTLERAEQRAVEERVELREVDKHIQQAQGGVRIAWLKWAPQLNLMASYQHVEGSPFQQKDGAYVGGTLSWDVWDWGSTIGGIHQANARLRMARTAREKVGDQILLEVREAYLNLDAAKDAMDVAKAAVAAAEENFRLVGKRYDANTATSFDVVDAEGLLTQARGQLQTATYDYLIARAALKRAIGESRL